MTGFDPVELTEDHEMASAPSLEVSAEDTDDGAVGTLTAVTVPSLVGVLPKALVVVTVMS